MTSFAVGSKPYEPTHLESGYSSNSSDYPLTGRITDQLPPEMLDNACDTCLIYTILTILFIVGISLMMLYGDTRVYVAFTDTLQALNGRR